ncbi:MAG: gliding motility-associated C-terminal domain-containing protein, partial [Bacteroidetes bacterium]|nr:gliding motility-associated C-terminal domain-containing protein [Bacteroidota bacterium]
SIQNFAQGSAGTYTYTVTDHCQGTQTDSFVISEPAPISFAGSQDLCAFDPSEVLVQGGLQPYTYITSPTLILDSLTNIITGTANEIVDVTITDACNQSAVIPFIVVVCDTKEPNIMIINNDGLNESFIVEGIESFPNSKVEVYNRWGTLVYESSNYDNANPWKAEDLEDGVYYWILMRSDGVSRDGYVHVMRK